MQGRLFKLACGMGVCLALVGMAWAAGNGQAPAILGAGATLVDNREFTPPKTKQPALEPFVGAIQLSEIEMTTEPATFKSRDVLGKDPKIFPGVALSFFTHGDDLVPTTQDVIRYGSTPQGRSYWDMIVQPGKVWSVATEEGWSRASFPFSLVHSIEGETHNGVAMFAYKGNQITNLRFQITQQTAPFYVEDYFTAFGEAPATRDPRAPANAPELARVYERSLAASEQLRPWSELEEKVGKDALSGFDSDLAPTELVADGLVVEGTLYLRACPSAAGELAYCDRQRFGVWSVTKAAANAVALLRLAQRYGEGVFDEKLVAYLPEASGLNGWDKVTFGDLLNMASGLGNGSDKREPNDINDGYIDDTYGAWYEARSEQEKIAAVLRDSKVYPWGPGQVARYRDEDMFLLGVAMKRYLQAKEGPQADLWKMLKEEVFEPIGIFYAPTNKTIEDDESRAQPLMAYGFYPTIGDLVKIAALIQNGGKFQDRQILHPGRLADILPSTQPRGLATGNEAVPAYRKAFWQAAYLSANGCTVHFPVMLGWGSNLVPIFSNEISGIRLAKNWDGAKNASKLDSLAAVADRIAPLCTP